MARLDRNRGEQSGDIRLPDSPTKPSPEVSTPDISEALINYLNTAFPDALPPVGAPYSDLERAWGRREVIAHLIRIKEQNEQEENVSRRIISSSGSGPSASSGPGSSRTGSSDLQ